MGNFFCYTVLFLCLICPGCINNLEEAQLPDPATIDEIAEVYDEAKKNINNSEKAYVYADKMLNLALEINSQKDIGNAYNIMGAIRRSENNYVESLRFYQKSSTAFEICEDTVGMAKVYNNIGNIYRDISKHNNAIVFYKKSLTLKTWLNDKEGIAVTNRNIAFVYQLMKEYEKAKDSYWTSLYTWKKLGDETRMAQLYNDLGIIYELILESGESVNYEVEKNIIYNLHLNALELNRKKQNQKGMGWVYNNIATSYLERGEYEKALENLNKSLTLKLKLNDEEGLATTYNNLGFIQMDYYKDLEGAISYFKKAELYASDEELKKTYEYLASALELQGDYASAISYIKKLDTLKENLRKNEYQEELAQIEAKYSVEYAGL